MSIPEVKLKSVAGRLTSFLLLSLTLTPTCDAFFRNLMISDTAMARIDPIVNRGEAATHIHHLNGGGNLNFESTGESLSQSTCTSSILTQDKSAYWTPWLYFQHSNGSFESVQLALGLTAYYKYEKRGNTGGDVEYSVFPKGLKMIAGDTNKRTWKGPWPVPAESFWGKEDTTQDALASKAMGFNCMNYHEPAKTEPSFAFPWLRNKEYLDQNCINGVRAEIIFPSCWDGENLDSDDHKSHLAYPTLIQDGVCPKTHPIYLPILFYETIWQTNAFKGVPGGFVFANGDPTGFGYHADFIAAWDDGVQEQIRDDPTCTGLTTDGEVSNCRVFDGKIQSQAEAASCKLTIPDEVASEDAEGVLDALPGGVRITGSRHDPGEQPADEDPFEPSTSVPKARSSATATRTDAAATSYWHSEATDVASVSVPSVPSASVPITTMATSPKPIMPVNVGSTSTTTYTSGKYVVEMVLVQMLETVTATTAPAMTNTVVVNVPEASGPHAKARRNAHRHARRHIGHSHGRL